MVGTDINGDFQGADDKKRVSGEICKLGPAAIVHGTAQQRRLAIENIIVAFELLYELLLA